MYVGMKGPGEMAPCCSETDIKNGTPTCREEYPPEFSSFPYCRIRLRDLSRPYPALSGGGMILCCSQGFPLLAKRVTCCSLPLCHSSTGPFRPAVSSRRLARFLAKDLVIRVESLQSA
jgi:hypothetical protein